MSDYKYNSGYSRKQMVKVISNVQVGKEYFLLQVLLPDSQYLFLKNIERPLPGQFYHLKINENNISYDPLLRRPLSIHNFDEKKGILSFLYRIVGRGTEIITKSKPGDRLDILGPLGRGFKTDLTNKKLLIVGGGMGAAPLYYLSRKINNNNEITTLLGFNSASETDYFKKIFAETSTELKISTLDGSTGFQGTVIDLLKEGDPGYYDYIFSCGPRIMLKRLKIITTEQSIPGQVSLEEKMGCGTGVCLSCVCKTETGNQRVCAEGPVFDISDIVFNEGDGVNA